MKLIAKSRDIKNYENKTEDDLIKILNKLKIKISLYKKRIKEIRGKFNEWRYKFSKSKRNEIGKILYEIKNNKNLSTQKLKEIEKNLLELEKNLFKLKKALRLWWCWIQRNKRCKKFIWSVNWWKLL